MLQKIIATIPIPFLVFGLGMTVQAEDNHPIDPAVSGCISSAIGADRFNVIRSGQPPTSDEEAKMKACFSQSQTVTSPSPLSQPSAQTTSPPQSSPSFTMNPAVEKCAIQALGQDRFTAIKSGQAQPTEAERTKVQTCFTESRSELPRLNDAKSPEVKDHIDPLVMSCMKAAVGEDRFKALVSGSEKPTDADKQAGEACFHKSGKEAPTVTTATTLPTNVKQCLILAVGTDRFNAISKGEAATLIEREAGEKCFGTTSGPIHQSIEVKIDGNVEACLKKAVGEDRFRAISAGALPSDDERSKGEACLKKIPVTKNSASVILPPAAQTVPYLPEKPDVIKIETVQPKVSQNINSFASVAVAADTASAKTVTLKGKATPRSVVDLYIFSDPLHVTTQADTQGNWTYTLERDLPAGNHTAYAATKASGQNVRSKMMPFTIAAAQAVTLSPTVSPIVTPVVSLTPLLATPLTSTAAPSSNSLSGLVMLIIALVILFAIILVFVLKQRKNPPVM